MRKSAKKCETFDLLDAATDGKKMQVLRLTTPNLHATDEEDLSVGTQGLLRMMVSCKRL